MKHPARVASVLAFLSLSAMTVACAPKEEAVSPTPPADAKPAPISKVPPPNLPPPGQPGGPPK